MRTFYRTIITVTSITLAHAACTNKGPVAYREVPTTYCNPMNLDYAYVPSTHTYYAQDESHRSTADPAIVLLRDTFYLFSTNQFGSWWSADMRTWHFVRKHFKVNGQVGVNVRALVAWAWRDTLQFLPSFAAPVPMPL